MAHASDICGMVFKKSSAVLLARVVDKLGENVETAEIESIRYSIYELDPCRPDHLIVVDGHDDIELEVSDVIFDALQTGGLWTLDDVGYNFRHEVDVSTAEAFPKAGMQYQVRYEFVPTAGQKTIVRFQLRVI